MLIIIFTIISFIVLVLSVFLCKKDNSGHWEDGC